MIGPIPSKQRVYLISLGCAKNLVDSENMLGILKEKGFIVVSDLGAAEIAIINTCGFIQSSVEEALDTILEVAAEKKKGNLKKLFVVGCLVQRYGYKLQKELPEVDGWIGTGEIHRIANVLDLERCGEKGLLIGRPSYLADHKTPRLRAAPFHTAYLKIAEGCSHRCTYCTIRKLRGPFRSRKPGSLSIEAEGMTKAGVKEINLIAQDTTMYGRDLKPEVTLEDLLARLVKVGGIRWIRILYGHPQGVSNRLLEMMEKEEVICPYLDLPLQHVNAKVLKAMGRGDEGPNPWELIERIRSRKRPISLRTTLMLGFPGETEQAFRELYEFVKAAKFDHLGVFIFSPERGTPAALLPNRVKRGKAEERLDAIMRLQAEISEKNSRAMVGEAIPVLIEGVSDETDLLLRGRTATMAPDVDGQVLINKGVGRIGEIVRVRITEAHAYDLVGEIL
jgi:ribosomal protein S12 methylthiotransferase